MNKMFFRAAALACILFTFAAHTREVPRQVAAQPANGGRTGFVVTPDGRQTISTFADGTVVTNTIKVVASDVVVSNVTARLNERLILDAERAKFDGDLTLAAESARAYLQSRVAGQTLEKNDGGDTGVTRKE